MKRLSLWFASISLSLCLGLGDSIWGNGALMALSDPTATAVGDLLTVVVRQSSTATKNQNRNTSKKSNVSAKINSFLFSPAASSAFTKGGNFPALNAETENKFEGGGEVSDVAVITDRFTVRVVDVLPNGNLLVEGRRSTTVSGEISTIVLRAAVRKADVFPDNTVQSTQLADLTLRYENKGNLNDSQKRGWFGWAWDKLNPL